MSVNMGTAVGYLDLDTSKFTAGFKTARTQMQTFMDDSQTLSARTIALGNSMQSMGRTMSVAVTVPLLAVGTAAVATAAKFDASMSEVQAISGATGYEFTALAEKAKQMGATTKFTASESAQALKYMAMAGWDTTQMLDGLDGVMLLAAASGEELATTSDIVTDAMTAFGLEAKEAGHFSDVLAQASNRSNTSVALLGESFKYVAPVAGALNYTIEDTATALGIMANQGIKGSMAGTSLRTMITGLIKPTDEAASIMELLGIRMEDTATGAALPLDDVMRQLRTSFADLTETQQAEYAATLAGQRGMAGLLAIVNTSEHDFNQLTTAMANSTGTTQEMADVMMNNLQGQLTILKSSVEGIGISFGQSMTPMVSGAVSKIQELADWIGQLDDEQRQMIITVGLVAAAIGPVLLIGGKVVTMFGTIGQGIKNTIASLVQQKAAIMADAAAYTANTTASTLNTAAKMKGKAAVLAATVIDKAATVVKAAQTKAEIANTAAQTGGIAAKLKSVAANIAAAAAQGGYNVVTGIATVVTGAFSAALNAIPLILVATLIIAVIAGLVKLISWLAKGSKENQEYQKTVDGINERHQSLKDTLAESKTAYEGTGPAIEAAATQSETYADKVFELQRKLEGMSEAERANAREKYQLQVYIEKLNESQEGLNMTWNEEENTLSHDEAAVRSMIAAKKELAKAQALQERTVEITKSLMDVEAELILIEKQRDDLEQNTTLTQREKAKQLHNLDVAEKELMGTRDEVTGQLEVYTEMQVDAAEQAAQATTESVEVIDEELTLLEEKYGVTTEAILADMDAQNISADEWARQQDDAIKEVEQAFQSYVDITTNGFEQITQKQTISLDQFIENMRKNQEATAQWSNNMNTLMEAGIGGGVIAQLESMGPAGAQQTQVFVDELNNMGYQAGLSLDQQNENVQAKIEELNTVLGDGTEQATEEVEKEWQRKGYIESGSKGLTDMANKMKLNKSVSNAAKGAITEAKSAAVSQVTASNFPSLGTDMISGIITGLNNKAGDLYTAIRNIIKKALAEGQAEAKTGSPAKAWADGIGRWLPAGVAMGVEDNEEVLMTSVQRMMKNAATAAQGMLKTSTFEGELVTGAGSGATMNNSGDTGLSFVAQVASKLAELLRGNTYNFYSPKALDEDEAARQMRLQTERMALELI